MSFFFKDSGNKPLDPKIARKRATLFSLPFAAMGFIALILFLHDGMVGGFKKEMAKKLGSVMVVSVGFVALIFGIAAKKSSLAAQSDSTEAAEKPWCKREDWAAGKIKPTEIPHGKSYLTMGIVLCILGAIIAALVVPKSLRAENYSALVALIFPLVGIIFLISVLKKIHAHRRFGDCHFITATVPLPIGGALAGVIETSISLKLENELRLNLLCIRKTTSGTGQNRRTTEKILWQDEKIFKTPADLPELESGKIPVQFDVPPGQPESSERDNQSICWTLRAITKVRGKNFHASFEVPVFKIADSSDANTKPV